MLAWESNWVVEDLSSLSPMFAVVTKTAEIMVSRYRLGATRDPLQASDEDLQGASASAQLAFFLPALDPMASNLLMRLAAHCSTA